MATPLPHPESERVRQPRPSSRRSPVADDKPPGTCGRSVRRPPSRLRRLLRLRALDDEHGLAGRAANRGTVRDRQRQRRPWPRWGGHPPARSANSAAYGLTVLPIRGPDQVGPHTSDNQLRALVRHSVRRPGRGPPASRRTARWSPTDTSVPSRPARTTPLRSRPRLCRAAPGTRRSGPEHVPGVSRSVVKPIRVGVCRVRPLWSDTCGRGAGAASCPAWLRCGRRR